MKKVMLTASLLTLAIAGPAHAQQTLGADVGGDENTTVLVNDLLDVIIQDNAPDSTSVSYSDDDNYTSTITKTLTSTINASDDDSYASQTNGNTAIVASQTLNASISNKGIDTVVDMNEVDDYSSGSNSVRGQAFAAFAGILNQAWNTGINANTQAATNIAAQGNVTFGDAGGPE